MNLNLKHIGWYYELASFYNKEKDEYSGWEPHISFHEPNAGRGMRNVKKIYINQEANEEI